MKRMTIATFLVVSVIVLALSITAMTHAQSGGGYDLTWNVIAGGGATSSMGGTYSLNGTIAQADAGTMSGGSYSLIGGFWVDSQGNHLFLPLIEK